MRKRIHFNRLAQTLGQFTIILLAACGTQGGGQQTDPFSGQLTARANEWAHCYRAKLSEDPTVGTQGPTVDGTPHSLVEFVVARDGTVQTATVVRETIYAQQHEGGGVRQTEGLTPVGECLLDYIRGIHLDGSGEQQTARFRFRPEVACPDCAH